MGRLTPMKAIRAKCMDCSAGSYKEVKLCPITECSLYPYRFGHNPARKGIRNSGAFQKTDGSGPGSSSERVLEGSAVG